MHVVSYIKLLALCVNMINVHATGYIPHSTQIPQVNLKTFNFVLFGINPKYDGQG